jgi:hypothetical protein
MELSFFYSYNTWIVSLTQFTIMLLCIRLGQYVATRNKNYSSDNPSNTAIAASIYGLLGLLLAFTFNMSGDRFKARKQIFVQEATQISTAILRTQLYADSVKPSFTENFKPYLEARIEYYEAHTDTARIREALRQTEMYRKKLWNVAWRNSRIPQNLVASNQMVAALNQMFDTGTTRFWTDLHRTPAPILAMLFILSFAAAFLGGYNSVGKGVFDWFLASGFCLFISMVIFFIIDLDKPRSGIITLDSNQKAMTELRQLFEANE